MLARLKRHPFAVKALLRRVLVLTYSYPAEVLQPLLPPGLQLDTFQGQGFAAIALVETRSLRPSFLPGWLGADFFLAGVRVFTRFSKEDKTRRGLRILRSYADKPAMVFFGNCLTHYNYREALVHSEDRNGTWRFTLQTPGNESHLELEVAATEGKLPEGSPFATFREALRFAGPLPFTFDYERETHSIVQIEGVREHWKPRLANVAVLKNSLLSIPPMNVYQPIFASAFVMKEVPYLWKKGIRYTLPRGVR